MDKWTLFGGTINNAFFFVVDKIIDLQNFFISQSMEIGKVVLLIAILSAALNYALTGTGLKENIIKILKATLFFLIVILAYPKIIGFITSWTYEMAEKSVGNSVKAHFSAVTKTVEDTYSLDVFTHIDTNLNENVPGWMRYSTFTRTVARDITIDNQKLFSDLTEKRKSSGFTYTTFAPASVARIVFFLAGECFKFADDEKTGRFKMPEFSRILKGLICGFFIILTGVFALLEYSICFLEFMLVASVGVILFPLSIWEGSKFMAEKFIGALVGFFMKLLFCNIAIFLMLYGFISLFYIIQDKGFSGAPDQIIFIIFVCLLFFYICKSAPGIAQSLLSGTPSLSATGAISAAAGAVAAAGATMGFAKNAGAAASATGGAIAGGIAKTGVGAAGSLAEAGAAAGAVSNAGGSRGQQIKAFMGSLASDAGDSFKAGALGLTRSLLSGNGGHGSSSGGTNPHSWREDFLNTAGKNNDGSRQTLGEHFGKRLDEGARRGQEYVSKHGVP